MRVIWKYAHCRFCRIKLHCFYRSGIGLITDNYSIMHVVHYPLQVKINFSFKTIESTTMNMGQQLATVTFQVHVESLLGLSFDRRQLLSSTADD